MIEIGKITLGDKPSVAIVVRDKENNDEIKNKAFDVLEIRVDQFENLDVNYIKGGILGRRELEKPIILTIRNQKEEGGEVEIPDEDKLNMFKALIDDVDIIDIELSSPILVDVVELGRNNTKAVIVSSHNFVTTPEDEDLEELFQKAKSQGADIVKIAAKANTEDDVFKMMQFTFRHKKDNIITMSLGEIGTISRLVLPYLGSLLTYSFISKASAPGQIPLETLQEHIKFYFKK